MRQRGDSGSIGSRDSGSLSCPLSPHFSSPSLSHTRPAHTLTHTRSHYLLKLSLSRQNLAQLESSSLVAVLGQSILISFTTGAPIQLRDRECVRVCACVCVCACVRACIRERERVCETKRMRENSETMHESDKKSVCSSRFHPSARRRRSPMQSGRTRCCSSRTTAGSSQRRRQSLICLGPSLLWTSINSLSTPYPPFFLSLSLSLSLSHTHTQSHSSCSFPFSLHSLESHISSEIDICCKFIHKRSHYYWSWLQRDMNRGRQDKRHFFVPTTLPERTKTFQNFAIFN